jgi:hypothetical protein
MNFPSRHIDIKLAGLVLLAASLAWPLAVAARTPSPATLPADLQAALGKHPLRPAGDDDWSELEVSAGDGDSSDNFGISIAIDGDTALIGAPEHLAGGHIHQGAAYVFTRSGGTWTETQEFTSSDGAASDHFGESVAIEGDVAVVGAWHAAVDGHTAQGAAYVFSRSGGTWSETQKLVASDGAAQDEFGWELALDGTTVVVGAPEATVDGNAGDGAAYVFTRAGDTWSETQKLVPADPGPHDYFGQAIALDGGTLALGAHSANVDGNNQQGAVYLFTATGDAWSQSQKLLASDGGAGGHLGWSLALDGSTLLVGAQAIDDYTGEAYIFTASAGVWSEAQILVASDRQGDDQFGYSVALDGDHALIGAVGSDVGTGSAYLFTEAGGSWSEEHKFVASNASASDAFGYAAALQGASALISAAYADFAVHGSQGALYIYDEDGALLSPTVAKSFEPASVTVNAASTASIILANANATPAVLATDLVDALPPGLVASAATTTCDGSAAFTATSVTLSAGATIPATGSCTLTATVAAADPGSYVNTIDAGDLVTDAGANASAASATLTVIGNPPPAATVTPDSLSLSAAADATANATLDIANAAGSDPLQFSIVAQDPAQAHVALPLHAAGLRDRRGLGAGPRNTFSSAPRTAAVRLSPAPALPAAVDGSIAFQVDDGSYEDTISLNNAQNGGNQTSGAVWINRFAVDAPVTVDSISIEWPSTGGLSPGMQPILVAYYDADADGDPGNALRLGSDAVVTIDTFDSFQTYPVNFVVPGAGDVYLGFVDAWGLVSGGYEGLVYAAALDETTSQGASYVAGSSQNSIITDIDDLADNDLVGQIESFGLSGNWLIRATATSGGAACSGATVAWLAATPATGNVDDGSTTEVTVTADPAAGGLEPGRHDAELCITSNDPAQPVIIVPVSLDVTPGAVVDGVFCSGFESGDSGSCNAGP